MLSSCYFTCRLPGENRKIFHEQECEKTLITLLSSEVSHLSCFFMFSFQRRCESKIQVCSLMFWNSAIFPFRFRILGSSPVLHKLSLLCPRILAVEMRLGNLVRIKSSLIFILTDCNSFKPHSVKAQVVDSLAVVKFPPCG